MIIDLPSTTTSQVNTRLVELREQGGAVALGRVLTLVIVTDDGSKVDAAVEAANSASREHPCRVIAVARGARKAAARLDAQIRVGGDAGASEVVVLRLYGPLADQGASCVIPLLLPDAPVVAWWPDEAPAVPATDPIGQLAHRRITDAAAERNPIRALEQRRKSYTDGDTDLAWARLTTWRALLATALDLPPYEKVTGAVVTGESDSPSTSLLAAWLAAYLRIPVKRAKATSGEGIVSVVLERRSGNVELVRPDGRTGTLTQPGQPDRRVALQRRSTEDCLIEELRRLDPDEVYETSLKALGKVTAARGAGRTATARAGVKAAAGGRKTTTRRTAGRGRAATAADAGAEGKPGTEADTVAGAEQSASAPASAAAKTTARRTSVRAKVAGTAGKRTPKPAKRAASAKTAAAKTGAAKATTSTRASRSGKASKASES
ncbi:glucose-6-phosphate dehydrogenase assembly protein OpcA [Goodfellowiella coeruleoviolacea]|uniref:Glucose-6-phosphate dehydrogenase assembly protein OpcA n=1 Tax=Goodfellowiella coeruleoviolacea TaxID=334858 RepID=A0AAE3KJH8_9PSEU|nr:glucose-6-phosphate dehydrogenase assembly protein OpcA [Goodfellowiella coeruleoviolacea]MCP2170241.1 glucose-6-phosphate dehydrogenase assembly protein OpcA [Goodfellowiella coeruleoviolacea]